ncbi:MAG TPA: alpha/beta fold hydrolase [Actinomycetota bacterium]|nr:alpha/beta fold hydrolase [Actinomycetota bacterium]
MKGDQLHEEQVTLRSRDGLNLEAVLASAAPERGRLVLCHPHPQMGGTMNAPLLKALCDGLVERGWTVLRFNFRGIGRSEGQPSLGLDEVADAEGALDFFGAQRANSPLAIAGWSFGAAVAVRTAARNKELAACIAIAPPIKARPGITEGVPRPVDLELKTKLLVVCADNDELVSPRDCRTWAEYVNGARFEVLAGANHLFWAKYDDLLAVIAEFLDEVVATE